MSIVTGQHTGYTSGQLTWVRFECQDHTGAWHRTVMVSNDPAFVPEDHYAAVATRLEESLAEAEADEVLGG